ncbi:MAG TPA: hypothetical protein VFP10_08700 [Candidatus Eisenbacteria bacterium]|nr:hypothetical protein [Candidatus Eisenbacteria bacterium]
MVHRPSPRLASSLFILTVVLLLGCGRQVSRTVAPASSSLTLGERSALPNASGNQLPVATIVTPTPSTVFSAFEPAPIRFEWTGEDPDGHLREYRFRVFGRKNPDFPFIADFVAHLESNSELVLSYYESVKWEGWERVQIKKDPRASATYSALLHEQLYAFVVVAIDNRGAHDAELTRERNIIQFALAPYAEIPSLTFVGYFGQITMPSSDGSPVVVPPPYPQSPFEVSWFATPTPGTAIEGYLSNPPASGLSMPTSLADTTATVSPPPDSLLGSSSDLTVEVEFDHGKRELYWLRFSSLFPGAAATASTRAFDIER